MNENISKHVILMILEKNMFYAILVDALVGKSNFQWV